MFTLAIVVVPQQRWMLDLLTVYEVRRTDKQMAYKDVETTVGSSLTKAISESVVHESISVFWT